MAERAFLFFGSSLKADKKEDNHKKLREGAAVFGRAELSRGLNLVPSFCVTHPGVEAFDKVGTDPAPGRPPFPAFPKDFPEWEPWRRREKCREDLL